MQYTTYRQSKKKNRKGRGRDTGRVEFMGHLVDTEYVAKNNETK